MSDIKILDNKHICHTYRRFDVELVEGKGSIIRDTEGREYIDMGSGIGVTSFGIADDEWVEATSSQLSKLQHTSNLYYTQPCANLAHILCEKTGLDKVFFSNSGAEANECAIKVCRKYASEKKGEDYYTIITLVNSFHGRTLTTLSATGQDCFHQLFNPLTPGFEYAIANDISSVEAIIRTKKVAGIMIECVQGEGGVNPLNADFVTKLADICDREDVLLIVDEVQTGNGRTGKLYGYMNYGINPDVVTTAKGLGGGLPIGATMLSSKVSNVLGYGDHGSTFGGNPVSCAGAISIVERLNDAFLEDVQKKSKYIFDYLSGADGIESVSGMGLMIGIKTVKPAIDVVKQCILDGVLCLTAKDKVRLLPALNIPYNLLTRALDVIKNACK